MYVVHMLPDFVKGTEKKKLNVSLTVLIHSLGYLLARTTAPSNWFDVWRRKMWVSCTAPYIPWNCNLHTWKEDHRGNVVSRQSWKGKLCMSLVKVRLWLFICLYLRRICWIEILDLELKRLKSFVDSWKKFKWKHEIKPRNFYFWNHFKKVFFPVHRFETLKYTQK